MVEGDVEAQEDEVGSGVGVEVAEAVEEVSRGTARRE